MEDRLGRGIADDLRDAIGVADVGLHELGALGARAGEVRLAAGGEIVDHDDLVPARDEGIDDVAPDEAGPAGDERTHGASG